MNLFKKIIAGALLAGSVTFAVLIIASNNPSPSASATSLAESDQSLPAQNDTGAETLPSPVKNLTADVSQAIGKEIASSGATSPAGLQAPEAVADQYLSDASKDFDYNTLRPKVDTDKLHIVPTNDQRLVAIYIKGLSDAMSAPLKNIQLAKKDTLSNLSALDGAYAQTIGTLYEMAIPQLFAHLHENIIANLGGQKAATEMIQQNYQIDPVRALLGLQAITKLNDDLRTIQRAVIDLAGKN